MIFQRSFDRTMRKAQAHVLKFAEAIARNHNADLDYKDDSTSVLDQVLEGVVLELHNEGLNNKEAIANHDGVKGITESFGCYIVAVAERNHGRGKWINEDPEDGGACIAFTLSNGNTIFPIEWIMKKLLDPQHYSVKNAYHKFVLGDMP